jgi:hypothetical protein
VLDQLGPQIAALAAADQTSQANAIAPHGVFDPFKMVDACQAAVRNGDDAFCRQVQQLEWELLFDHCYRHALGR